MKTTIVILMIILALPSYAIISGQGRVEKLSHEQQAPNHFISRAEYLANFSSAQLTSIKDLVPKNKEVKEYNEYIESSKVLYLKNSKIVNGLRTLVKLNVVRYNLYTKLMAI